MVVAAGAPFVVRWTTYHPRQMTRCIKKALQKKGFSLIEVISQCPVQFGRVSGLGSGVNMLKYYKENSVSITKAKDVDPEALEGKIIVGEFVDREKAELTEEYARIMRQAAEED